MSDTRTFPPRADYCDKCGNGAEVSADPKFGIFRLDTGGHSGVFLCRFCWIQEMHWREERNAVVCNPFKIEPFPGDL